MNEEGMVIQVSQIGIDFEMSNLQHFSKQCSSFGAWRFNDLKEM